MATRISGRLKLSVTYRDAGHYTGSVAHNGRQLYKATLNPPASGFGRGVSYDSPEAYDSVARSLLSFAINETEDVAQLAEYDASGNPVVVRGEAAVGRPAKTKAKRQKDHKLNGNGIITPDKVVAFLESKGFREVEQATDVDGTVGMSRAGFSAYYPTATSTERSNTSQVVVTHFARGEGTRPNEKQAQTKVRMVGRMAKALRDGGYPVHIASNGRRLTIRADADAKPNGNIAYLEDRHGVVFRGGSDGVSPGIVVMRNDVLWSSPDGRIIAAKVVNTDRALGTGGRHKIAAPTYAVIDRSNHTCSEPPVTNKQVAINNAMYRAIQVGSIVPGFSMTPCERHASKRNGYHGADGNDAEAAELVASMMNDEAGWRRMSEHAAALKSGDARRRYVIGRVNAGVRQYARQYGSGEGSFGEATRAKAVDQILYQLGR